MRIRYELDKARKGNCWVFGLWFWIRHAKRVRRAFIRRNHGRDYPHLMFELNSGNIAHYKVVNKGRLHPLWSACQLEMFRGRHLKKAIYRTIYEQEGNSHTLQESSPQA